MSQFWQNLQPRLQPAVPNGKEVIQRLLLDRIDREARGLAVGEIHETPGFVLADEAEAGLALRDLAETRTEEAEQLAVRERPPPPCFVRGGGHR
jgi:hypothetical protein